MKQLKKNNKTNVEYVITITVNIIIEYYTHVIVGLHHFGHQCKQ